MKCYRPASYGTPSNSVADPSTKQEQEVKPSSTVPSSELNNSKEQGTKTRFPDKAVNKNLAEKFKALCKKKYVGFVLLVSQITLFNIIKADSLLFVYTIFKVWHPCKVKLRN